MVAIRDRGTPISVGLLSQPIREKRAGMRPIPKLRHVNDDVHFRFTFLLILYRDAISAVWKLMTNRCNYVAQTRRGIDAEPGTKVIM